MSGGMSLAIREVSTHTLALGLVPGVPSHLGGVRYRAPRSNRDLGTEELGKLRGAHQGQ
jgi:hypothetical protein